MNSRLLFAAGALNVSRSWKGPRRILAFEWGRLVPGDIKLLQLRLGGVEDLRIAPGAAGSRGGIDGELLRELIGSFVLHGLFAE